jgi:hypothetical protein
LGETAVQKIAKAIGRMYEMGEKDQSKLTGPVAAAIVVKSLFTLPKYAVKSRLLLPVNVTSAGVEARSTLPSPRT